jgi:hypothetical protein
LPFVHAVPSATFGVEQLPLAQLAVWQTPAEHGLHAAPPFPHAEVLVPATHELPFQHPVQQLPP